MEEKSKKCLSRIRSKNKFYFFEFLAKFFACQILFYLIVFSIIIVIFLNSIEDLIINKKEFVIKEIDVYFTQYFK